MSGHFSKQGLIDALSGALDERSEAALLAHLRSEPDCAECEALFAGLKEHEEQALVALLAGVEQARDPGDAWQAQALVGTPSGQGMRWRWAALGLGLSLALLLFVGFWMFRPGPGAGTDEGQRIKGVESLRPALLNLRAGRIVGETAEARPVVGDQGIPAAGKLVFFVEADSACRLWLARLGPKGPEGLVGYANTPFLQLDAGESLLRTGDRALGLELAGLRGELLFLAGCMAPGAQAPALDGLRADPPAACRSLRLRVEAP